MTDTKMIDLEKALGGSYELSDGRKFWIDHLTVREIMRRIELARPADPTPQQTREEQAAILFRVGKLAWEQANEADLSMADCIMAEALAIRDEAARMFGDGARDGRHMIPNAATETAARAG